MFIVALFTVAKHGSNLSVQQQMNAQRKCGMCVYNIPIYTMDGEGNGTPLQYSCLENPVDGGTW